MSQPPNASITGSGATYSLTVNGVTSAGIGAGQVEQTAAIALPDNAGLVGAARRSMQLGTAQLCQRPDGSVGWFVIDAERSILPSRIVLRPLS